MWLRTFPVWTLAAMAAGCIPMGGGKDSERYQRVDLVSDQSGPAAYTDNNLVNPWGLAFGPETYFWVANEGTGTSTLYDGDGMRKSDVIGGPVTIAAAAAGGQGTPTGLVYNGTDGFPIMAGNSGPSRFIFVTTDGTIQGWNPDVDMRNSVVAYDGSADGSKYLGATMARSNGQPMLYVTNFAAGVVEVFDQDFMKMDLGPQGFVDPQVPEGYVPFGIHALDDRVYVTWGLKNGDEEQTGPGLGYVDVFEPDGTLVDTVASGEMLDAPWGMARAPDTFGTYARALLIGNFGDGHITAYNADSYEMLGQLTDRDDELITIDGLWAMLFGNDMLAGKADELYFTAGPNNEANGLFGVIRPE